MSLFSKILSKLGIGKKEEEEKTAAPKKTVARKDVYASRLKMMAQRNAARSKQGSDMAMVDVMSKLDGMANANAEKLNWKVSIIDLLKLLDLPANFNSLRELADDLGAPDEYKDGTAEMNVWLHKEVLKEVAANGGNVPKDMLD